MNRIGVQPFHVERVGRGQHFGLGMVEDCLEPAFTNGVQNGAMLIAKHLFLLLFAQAWRGGLR